MQIERLENKICDMQYELQQKINELNNGGCIHFAYYFSEALKNLKIPHKVYLAHVWRKIGNTYATFHAVSHVVVFIEGIGYIDGHETVDQEDMECSYKYCRQTKLNLDNLRCNYEWNSTYRWHNNVKLKKIINTYISDN
jgi:hypothetical protein